MKKKINLLPLELRKKEKKSFLEGINFKHFKKVIIIFLPFIVWKLLIWGINLKMKSTIEKKTKEITELTQKIETLKTSAESELKIKQEKLNLLKEEISLKEEEIKKLKPVAELVSRRKNFIYELLKTIAEYIPEEVWLEEISIEKEEDNFSLKGFGLNYKEISLFLSKLNQFPYLKELYLKQSEIKNEERYPQAVIQFEINGKINL